MGTPKAGHAGAAPQVFAGLGNRAAALLLDVVLVVAAMVHYRQAALPLPEILPLAALLYFAGLPLTRLQGTPGKWLFRIKLCDRLGRPPTLRAIATRTGATVFWLAIPVLLANRSLPGGIDGATLLAAWFVLSPLPWASAGILPRRESLFDLLAGTLVVRIRAGTEAIACAAPVRKPGLLNSVATAAVCIGIGVMLSLAVTAQHDMNRRGRILYAMQQVAPLQRKVADFHAREQRWPNAAELGVAASTPYPHGGGYRLQADGRIVITFSVLPDLKGRSIVLRPQPGAGGKIDWRCSTQGEFKPVTLPGPCRAQVPAK